MQSSASTQGNQLDLEEQQIDKRIIVEGDVFELEAYGKDEQELKEEGYRLLDKGFSGIGFKTIREFIVDETEVNGVYGLWIR